MFRSLFKSIFLVSLFWIVYGFSIPNYEGYITDTAGVFSETEKTNLTTKIEEIQKATSIEIAILTVSSVDDDINLAAVDVGNKWWVGKKGQNNGLLVLIAVDDKKWSIQVGYWLEGTLPDLATKRIAEARFPPNFREGNYYQGVFELLDDALWYIKEDPTIVWTYSQDAAATTSSDKDYLGLFIMLLFFSSIFGRWITVPSSTNKGRKLRKYGRWMYAGAGIILSLVISSILASFVFAFILSYVFLFIWIIMSLSSKTGWDMFRFGGGWSGFGGGGWWFWGFGGGSFGGGWSSWSR